jgi:hypothetical protein
MKKKELKHWEDMVPVNNMDKLARQTKIDNLKIVNGQYRNIENK